jgi:hypothetical protein
MAMDRDDVIDQLNSFLRGEISAVETYRMAIDRVKSATAREDIARCLDSHEERVDRIRARVVEFGGDPSDGSGVWGAFAKLMQGGADLFGDRSAISALEEGEDHGRDDYRRALEKIADKMNEPISMGNIGAGMQPSTVAGVTGADIGLPVDENYRGDAFPDELRAFTEQLLEEQLETHRTMSNLKKSFVEETDEIRPVV